MDEQASIQMRAIGEVETNVADGDIARQRRTMVSRINIYDEFVPALEGLNNYSHIIVLFWMHHAQPSAEPLIRPRGNIELPLTGVLASRGRGHPNPIGLAVTELVELSGSQLTVHRLDAYNGTPIIDIKPYDSYDVYTDIRMPTWFAKRAAAAPLDETK
jgi:tRNA-Thr(GGU) m(6)t(6)A37 methyltransferase TsaA